MGKLKIDESYDTRVAPEFSGAKAHVGGEVTKGTRIVLVFLFFMIFVCGLQAATQWFALEVGYPPSLGESLINGIHFYPFYAILGWQTYLEVYPDYARDAMQMGLCAGTLPLLLIAFIKFKLSLKIKANRFLHGSARWANRKDIERMALLPHILTLGDKWYNFKANLFNFFARLYNRRFEERIVKFNEAINSETDEDALEKYKAKRDKLKKKLIKEKKCIPNKTSTDGVFVGAWKDLKGKTHYLRHNGPEHILCVAPTRSGKGVGLVNPTLLTWKHSTVITDLKGELWALTSGWRSKYANNYCIRFEPAKKRELIDKVNDTYNVARWNPFDEIRSEGSTEYYYDRFKNGISSRICDGTKETSDTQNIVTQIVDPKGEGLKDHWAKTAYELLVGCVVHLKHNIPEKCNIATLSLMLAGQIDTAKLREKRLASGNGDSVVDDDNVTGDVKNLWEDMAKGLDRDGKPYRANQAAIIAGAHMKDRPDEEAGSVLSTATSFLSLYTDPVVAENTSASDFRIRQIMNSDKPVSLYLVTEPTDKDRLSPLVKLFISLILTLCAADMEFEGGRSVQSYKNRMLLMLDEFPSLGKLEKMQESLAFIAGYGMKAYLITQDMAQLFDKYGKDESISSNCHVNIFYAPLKTDTAQIMSDKAGNTTILDENKSVSGQGLKASGSRSMAATARPLITKDECMQLPAPTKDALGNITKPGDMLVFVAGQPAIHGIQPLYFQNKTLLSRAQVPSPAATDVVLKDGHLIGEEEEEQKREI